MRIRTLLLAGITAVALPGLAGLGWNSWLAWSNWERAERATYATRVLNGTMRGMTAIAVESGQLSAAARTGAADPAELQASRRASDALLEAARRDVVAEGLDPRPIDESTRKFNLLRSRVSDLLARNGREGDPRLVSDLIAGRAEVLDGLEGVARSAEQRIGLAAPAVALLTEIARGAMTLRNELGVRSLVINAWMGGQPVTVASIANALRLNGRIEMALETARRLTGAQDDPELTAVLARMEADYVRGSEPRYRAFVDAALASLGQPGAPSWPSSAQDYARWTVPALTQVLPLRDAALDAAMEKGDAAAAAARTRLLGSLALAGLALLLAAAGVMLLLHRLVSPVRELTGEVGRIAAGDLEIDLPHRGRQDEVGEMAGAIEVLRVNSVAQRRLEAEAEASRASREARAAQMEGLVRGFQERAGEMVRTLSSAST
ncbi:HAMP domain-containing protein, partial [Roseomonas rosea]